MTGLRDTDHGTHTTPSEHPGFVCRREGHDTALKIITPATIESIVCACLRCGKTVEFKSPEVKRVG